MIILKFIKYNISKVIAITEKNIKLSLRFKYGIILSFITPIFSVLIPVFIMGEIFKFKTNYGPWTPNNFLIYQFIAYDLILLREIITEIPGQFMQEKFWQTLPAIIIAPINRFNLLIGIFLGRIVLISVPFVVFFMMCYIYYPISLITFIFIILVFFLIALIFCGMGLILGIFAVSNENVWHLLGFMISIFFLFSCITYPYNLFPEFVQNIINLNPLYYLFDILRFIWIENDIIYSIISHPLHIYIIIICAILFPSIGVFTFNLIFKKYGIVGA